MSLGTRCNSVGTILNACTGPPLPEQWLCFSIIFRWYFSCAFCEIRLKEFHFAETTEAGCVHFSYDFKSDIEFPKPVENISFRQDTVDFYASAPPGSLPCFGQTSSSGRSLSIFSGVVIFSRVLESQFLQWSCFLSSNKCTCILDCHWHTTLYTTFSLRGMHVQLNEQMFQKQEGTELSGNCN